MAEILAVIDLFFGGNNGGSCLCPLLILQADFVRDCILYWPRLVNCNCDVNVICDSFLLFLFYFSFKFISV